MRGVVHDVASFTVPFVYYFDSNSLVLIDIPNHILDDAFFINLPWEYYVELDTNGHADIVSCHSSKTSSTLSLYHYATSDVRRLELSSNCVAL